jgi:putative DNA primase/helicase
MSGDVQEAKQRLPLPVLMNQLGLGERATRSALCPFHEDGHPSFSVWQQRDGSWSWKCHAGCGVGDEITFLELQRRISNSDATKLFLEMAGLNGYTRRSAKVSRKEPQVAFDWRACVEAFTPKHLQRLAEWRGYSPQFCSWLHQRALIGLYDDCVAFPMHDSGSVVAAHYRLKGGSWCVHPKGVVAMRPLVIGDIGNARVIHAFESQWDAFAVADKLALHEKEKVALIITRGAGNGALVSGVIPATATVFAWKQNDEVKDGKRAGDEWLKKIAAHAGATVQVVTTPERFKDANEWTKAGATVSELDSALDRAEGVQPIASATQDTKVDGSRPEQPSNGLQGSEVNLADVEPWLEPVDGASVLNQVSETFVRYVVLPAGAADLLALWCAQAHAFKAFLCSPRLNIQSPEKGCGKTTLRDVIAVFVPKPLLTENLTAPVLFRLVQAYAPTILADECDAWLKDNEELRGLFNAGHRRGAMVYRCEGKNNEVRGFAAYAPAVLCGIGALPGTLHDRSIVNRLERAKPGELQQRFDSRRTDNEQKLCRQLARWTRDNFAQLESADPVLPEGVFNRLADNWRPVFAIAKTAGADWPQRAANAFTRLSAKADMDAEGIGTMLLADIRDIFERTEADPIPAADLVEALVEMEDRPWREFNPGGKPITTVKVGRILRRFGISTAPKRHGNDVFRGYDRRDFSEVFARYLTPTNS